MADLLAEFDTAHCGAIYDSQLDTYGECLATASADGHVRLWNLQNPKSPAFLSDLDAHAGPVHQVAWAPPEVGVLLASASADGRVIIWGRGSAPTAWHIVHEEILEQHGTVRAVAWAPAEHGAVLACACSDGTVAIAERIGSLYSVSPGSAERRWQVQTFMAHRGEAHAVSWSSPPRIADRAIGLSRARIASAGKDGVQAWFWDETQGVWAKEPMDSSLDFKLDSNAVVRDVAWKPWDGIAEMLASACVQHIQIWLRERDAPWRMVERVEVGADVWKVSWADTGNVLLASCGLDSDGAAVLIKQRLDGTWDVMDVTVSGDGV